MPLFKKKPFDLIKPPEDLKPKDFIFQVRFTKEIFKNYEDYINQISLYKQRIWTCKVTGKSNLTYEEALDSERKGIEQAQQFPREFIGPVLNIVQFSQLRFRELVSTILQTYKDQFVVGEELSCVQDNSMSAIKVLRVVNDEGASADIKLLKYEIGWLDTNKNVMRTSIEPAVRLLRRKPPFTRAMLMSFIRESVKESAMHNTPWVVLEQLCTKYSISMDPPEELRQLFEKQTRSVKPSKTILMGNGHLVQSGMGIEDEEVARRLADLEGMRMPVKESDKDRDVDGQAQKKQKTNDEAGFEVQMNAKENFDVGLEGHLLKMYKKMNVNLQGNNMKKKKDGITSTEGPVPKKIDINAPRKRKAAAHTEGHALEKPKKKSIYTMQENPDLEKANCKDSDGNLVKKAKNLKCEEQNGEGGTNAEKVTTVKVKYPIEDCLVEPCADDPPFTQRPIPSSDFPLPMDCIGHLLMVWDFCMLFGKAIRLSPFSLEELEAALGKEEDSVLLKEMHYALLNLVIEDSDMDSSGDERKHSRSKASISSWKDELCDFIKSEGLENLTSHLLAIQRGKYWLLETSVKLGILCELVNRALTSAPVRHQLEQNIEEKQAIAAEKRKQEVEELKRVKEEHDQLKQSQNMSSVNPNESPVMMDCNIESTAELNGEEIVINSLVEDWNVEPSNGCGLSEASEAMLLFIEDHLKTGSNGVTSISESKSYTGCLSNGINEDGAVEGDVALIAGRSRQQALKLKAALREAEEKEREKKKTEEQQRLLEKKKIRDEAKRERELQERKMLEQQKRQEQFEREIEKRVLRSTPLGRDRDHNKYWFFHREGRVFVEDRESTAWGYYGAKEEVEALYGSLNPKGVRECSLRKQLEKHLNKINSALQKRSKEIALRITMEATSVRRSSRGKPGASQALKAASYRNKYR